MAKGIMHLRILKCLSRKRPGYPFDNDTVSGAIGCFRATKREFKGRPFVFFDIDVGTPVTGLKDILPFELVFGCLKRSADGPEFVRSKSL